MEDFYQTYVSLIILPQTTIKDKIISIIIRGILGWLCTDINIQIVGTFINKNISLNFPFEPLKSLNINSLRFSKSKKKRLCKYWIIGRTCNFILKSLVEYKIFSWWKTRYFNRKPLVTITTFSLRCLRCLRSYHKIFKRNLLSFLETSVLSHLSFQNVFRSKKSSKLEMNTNKGKVLGSYW